MKTNLTLHKGDTHYLEVAVTREDSNGVDQPVNITDAKLWFTAKVDAKDLDEDAIIQKGTTNTTLSGIDITDAAGGEAVIKLDAADTEVGIGTQFLYWDLQMKETDNTITTLNSGRLALSDQITQAS
jgi:hypothetical protein